MSYRAVMRSVVLGCVVWAGAGGAAQAPVELTVERVVALALNHSYRIRRLELEVSKRQEWLKAHRAGLKSRVYLNMVAPDLRNTSDYEWNSTTERDELIRRNTIDWWTELSVRQPVVLFRYPTNGYISLNAKVKRYDQEEDDGWDLDYSNRLYAKYEQPLFVPNHLKHELEEAELDLEESKLSFTADRVDIINDVVRHYYWVFELAYRNRAHAAQLGFLDSLRELAGQVDTGSIDLVRIRIERTNVRERLLEDQGRYRRELDNLRQRLALDAGDSLLVVPRIAVAPLDIAVDTAIEKALELSPRLRQMAIWKRKEELDLASEKGYNSFRINLELTYGLEGSDRHFTRMWRDYETSGTAKVRAYVPLVDWGERRARVSARRYDVDRAQLRIEEAEEDLRKDVAQSVARVSEYADRTSAMQESLADARRVVESSLRSFAAGASTPQDVLMVIESLHDTELNLVGAYLGYRRALLDLMVKTYYDFEQDVSVVEAFLNEPQPQDERG